VRGLLTQITHDFTTKVDGCPMFPRISCRAWWRWRTSCGFPYRKPHTRTWLMQRAGNPVRPSVHGPITIFSNAFTPWVTRITLEHQSFPARLRALEGAAPRLFRPMYAGANMGHPSRQSCSDGSVTWYDVVVQPGRGVQPIVFHFFAICLASSCFSSDSGPRTVNASQHQSGRRCNYYLEKNTNRS
jgi:hypothetical protein